MTDAITVRRATCADAGAIARVHEASWRTIYRGVMPDAVLDGLSTERRERMWEHQICEGAEQPCIFVAETAAGAVTGFASGGPPQTDVDGYDCELHTVYLLQEQQGLGTGRRLLEAVARYLHARGNARIVLWALAGNYPSRSFYERLGRTMVASEPSEIGGAAREKVAYGYDLAALVVT